MVAEPTVTVVPDSAVFFGQPFTIRFGFQESDESPRDITSWSFSVRMRGTAPIPAGAVWAIDMSAAADGFVTFTWSRTDLDQPWFNWLISEASIFAGPIITGRTLITV